MESRDGGTFFQVWGGGLTSDFNWGAEETLLLVSLYFSEKLGGRGAKASHAPGSAVPGIVAKMVCDAEVNGVLVIMRKFLIHYKKPKSFFTLL